MKIKAVILAVACVTCVEWTRLSGTVKAINLKSGTVTIQNRDGDLLTIPIDYQITMMEKHQEMRSLKTLHLDEKITLLRVPAEAPIDDTSGMAQPSRLSMVNEDSNYKRIEDQKWRESVTARLVSLTDSEVTQNDRLDESDDDLLAVREMLEGKSGDRTDNGIKGDIHDLSVKINELRALLMPDHLGQGGIIARLKALEKKAGIEEHDLDNRWKFKTAVAIAIISAIVAILTNLDRIEPPVKKILGYAQESRPTKKHTGKTRRPRPVERPAEANDGPQEEMPQGRSGDGSHAE